MTISTQGRHIARNTLLVGASFALAGAVGLLRDMVVARHFGIGAELDAYYAAFRLPELLFTIVAGGALATAFIPVLAEHLAQGDSDGAWRLASAITNLVVIAASVLAALAALAAPMLVSRIIAPGFTPEAQAETASLMRLVLVSTIIFGISAVQTSMLHSFKHFVLPALAPIVYPLGIVMGALWLAPSLGVRGLAWGAIVGSLLHMLVQAPGLIHYGFRWQPIIGRGMPSVRQVLALMGPRVLDLAVWHLTLVGTTNLASRLGAGSIAALEWGWSVMQFPETMIGTAFGLVALPTLADLAAQRDIPGLRRTLVEILRAVLALTVPASVGLILLGRPLLSILYQRGAFDVAAGDAVFEALRWYALGLAGHACLELAARAFFAQKDTVRPLIIAAIWSAGGLAGGVLLMGAMGHGGLALANSLAITGEVVTLLIVLRRRWQGIEARQLAATLARVGAASAIMAGAVAGTLALVQRAGLGDLVAVAGGALVGLLAYLLAGAALGMQELRWPVQVILRRRTPSG
jgi:putative peptidoglycan lipid II flippase